MSAPGCSSESSRSLTAVRGDSRADALIDLLTKIWAQGPKPNASSWPRKTTSRSIISSILSEARLPVIGPLSQRVPLVTSRVRQGMMTEAVGDLGGFGNETNENLEAFQRGEAQILVRTGGRASRPEPPVRAGPGPLQRPVAPGGGRTMDRTGSTGLAMLPPSRTRGRRRSIDVYTIAQRDLVDEKVVSVLQHFHVFERSVNLDGEHLEEVAKLIEHAALRTERISWRETRGRN